MDSCRELQWPFIILRILNENQPDDDSKGSVFCKSIIIYNYILSFIFFLKVILIKDRVDTKAKCEYQSQV